MVIWFWGRLGLFMFSVILLEEWTDVWCVYGRF